MQCEPSSDLQPNILDFGEVQTEMFKIKTDEIILKLTVGHSTRTGYLNTLTKGASIKFLDIMSHKTNYQTKL